MFDIIGFSPTTTTVYTLTTVYKSLISLMKSTPSVSSPGAESPFCSVQVVDEESGVSWLGRRRWCNLVQNGVGRQTV